MSIEREQKLVDICFCLVLTALSEGEDRSGEIPSIIESWKGKSNDFKANWVRNQLRGCGFNVSDPVGCSWGMLQ